MDSVSKKAVECYRREDYLERGNIDNCEGMVKEGLQNKKLRGGLKLGVDGRRLFYYLSVYLHGI